MIFKNVIINFVNEDKRVDCLIKTIPQALCTVLLNFMMDLEPSGSSIFEVESILHLDEWP